MPMITMIQPGARVAPFAVDDARLVIGEAEVAFADAQDDTATEVVIRHADGRFVIGGDGGAIVAIVRLPARQYVEAAGEPDHATGAPAVTREALPLDHNAVTIELWPFAG